MVAWVSRSFSRRFRMMLGVLVGLGLIVGMVGPVSTAHAAPAPTGKVVLDPDDNYSFAIWGGTTYKELPITYAISQTVKTKLEALCDTSVVITRDASQDTVPRAQRAAMMSGADVSMTISLNDLTGTPWGTSVDGGAQGWSTSYSNNTALAQKSLDEWTRFTGRTNAGGPNQGATNGTALPYPEFAALSSTYAQTFFGFMDHNFDAPSIGVVSGVHSPVVNAVVTAIGRQLQAQGITCGNTGTGQASFPAPPTAAQLAALFSLGFGNWMRYGADPVNFATGNFLQSAKLFTVSGPGGSSTPIELTYNSLDNRSSRFGHGWSAGLDSRSQTYTDKSVLITGTDGSATAYSANLDGSYQAPAGVFNTLTRTSADTLVLTGPDGSKQTFTEDSHTGAGVLTARTDRAGHRWVYDYATTTVTVPGTTNPWPVAPDGSSGGSGAASTSYTSLGALTSITDPGGQKIAFSNDAKGRVTKVTRPDGADWTLSYDAAGNLVSVSDPLSHATAYSYDTVGRMVTVTAPDGVVYVHNTFDGQGRVIAQSNGDGKTSTITYNADGTTTYTDTTGAKTTFTTDTQGRVVKVTTPLGHTISTGYQNWSTSTKKDANGNLTSYQYDSQGRAVQVSSPDGTSTKVAYTSDGDVSSQTAADGGVTTYMVDGKGRVTGVTEPDNATWASTYDDAGNLTSRTDPNGHLTSYSYDGRGNLRSTTNAAGGVTTLAYDAANRLTSVTDAAGGVSTFGYDAVGNLTSRTNPDGKTSSYAYNATDKVTAVTDANGGKTSYTYNAGLQVETVTDPAGGRTKYGYDSEYRRTSVTNPDGAVTKYEYNGEGLLTKVTDPNGGVTSKEYDANQNVTKVTDAIGAVTTFGYDTMNRPITVTDAKGGKTSYAYDAAGRVTKVTDANKAATSYAYDKAGRVVKVTDPTGAVTAYAYDKAGNVVGSTDPNGHTTTVGYDKLNQAVAVTAPAGGVTSYQYDPAGRVTKKTDGAGRTQSFAYDPAGQLTSATDGEGASTRYAYDGVGNITGVTDPRGGTITLSYTPTNLLGAQSNQNGETTGYRYTAAGILSAVTNPLGVTTAYGHDKNGNLTQVVENSQAGSGSTVDANVTTNYAYDPANRLAKVTDAKGGTTAYAYDPLGALTKSTNQLGNVTSYSYDAVSQTTAVTDGNGKTTSYGRDGDGRITTVSPQGVSSATYTYDAAGQLTAMVDPTGKTAWAYTPDGLVASETTKAGTAGAEAVSFSYDLGGARTGLTYPDGSKVAYTLDKAGRVTSIADQTGTSAYAYNPSGLLTTATHSNGTKSSYGYDAVGRVSDIQHTGTTVTTNKTTASTQAPADPTPNATATPGATVAPSPTTPTLTPSTPTAQVPTPSPSPTATSSSTSSSNGNGAGNGCGNGGVTPGCPATTPTATPSPTQSPTPSSTPTPSAPSVTTGPGCGNGGVTPGCPMAALTAADGLPMHLAYTYDKAGNTTQLVQESATKTLTTGYSYDPLGRLTASTRTDGAKATYSYDANGNQTSGTETDRLTGQLVKVSATFNPANQLVKRTTSPVAGLSLDGPAETVVSNTFDSAGNLTVQTTSSTRGVQGNSSHTDTTTVTTKNTYDYTNHLLTQIRDDGQNTAYTYDGLGRTATQSLPTGQAVSDKTNKKNGTGAGPHNTGCGIGGTTPGCPGTGDLTMFGGATTRVFYDGVTPISWSGDSLSSNLVYGPLGPEHQITTKTTGVNTSWLYLDRQGTVRVTAGSDGVTTSASSYTDFGVLEPGAGTLYAGAGTEAAPGQEDKATAVHLPVATTQTPVGYTAEQTNPAAGLQHYLARDYQPGTAAWIQADTWGGVLARPGTLNKYTYVLDNPTTLIDRGGNEPAYVGCNTLQCRNYMYNPVTPAPSAHTVNSSQVDWQPAPPQPSPGNTVNSSRLDWQPGYAGPPAQPTPPAQQENPSSNSGHYVASPVCGYAHIPCSHPEVCPTSDTSGDCEQLRVVRGLMLQAVDKLLMGLLPIRTGAAGEAGAADGVAGITPQVIRIGGLKLPGVPKGIVGTVTDSGKGLTYAIPKGTPELDPRVTQIRIMGPTSGTYAYPNGYAVYMNSESQTVNPLTGQVIAPSDPYAHIGLP
ncbi:RHS repeat-associated protein [Psychromicrobium silvestre]|uniref:RHS repeat-associated protein n=1 Tax=Psychromicrobium silvestre TaxID=1645614 RepID=A0A7Y9LVA8_9MICC|nr:RHS repeat-associated core domain-containing protein [Psychromicrobium silvestre]NYE96239.1 RHS repeat-associated protein [Psychromicrobium silvestre]